MATPSLPLHCSICPKKPDFSDISHLLTHIASKGHLSNYYKVKVRSSHDLNSRQIIDHYDMWYSDWNVEALVSDRLALKDRKRANARTLALRPPKKNSQKHNLTLDPRLSGPFINEQTPNPVKAELLPHSIFSPAPIFTQPKLHRPRLHLWATRHPSSFDAIPLEFSSPPQIPYPSSRQFPQPAPFAPMLFGTDLNAPFDDDLVSEATKLKGLFWPGMDIFDAATTEMRRIRNQKKETWVVERLERNSVDVEANEMIFTPGGSLWKQRPISGHVDFDSSPIKPSHPSPLPLKRKRSSRVPLVERDINSSILPPRGSLTDHHVHGNDSVRNAEAVMEGPAKPLKKRKRKFDVFDDRQNSNASDRTSMRYLTAEFHQSLPVRYEPDPRTQRGFEGSLAAMYQPAYQHNFFADAFEPFQQTLYATPYHGYYGFSGYDLPGFFSYVPQVPVQGDFEHGEMLEDKKTSPDDSLTVSTKSDD